MCDPCIINCKCMLRRILLSCFMKRDRGVKDKGGDGGGICSLGRKMCARNFTCQPAPGHQPPEPASETSSSTFCQIFFGFFLLWIISYLKPHPGNLFLGLWRDFVGSIWQTSNIVFKQLCAQFFLSVSHVWDLYMCVRLQPHTFVCIRAYLHGNVYPRINVPVIDFL